MLDSTKRALRRHPSLLFVIPAIIVVVLASGVLLWAANSDPGKVQGALVDGAVQLLFVTGVGALFAYLARSIDVFRQDARRDEAARLETVRRAATAYNKVKAVRRTLHAIGIDPDRLRPPADAERARFFGEMVALNNAQLELEMAKREARIRSGAFGDPSALAERIDLMERYVNEIVNEWENAAPDANPWDPATLDRMRALKGFLGHPDQEGGIRKGHLDTGGEAAKRARPDDPGNYGPSAQLRRIEDLVVDPRHAVPDEIQERDDARL